MKPAAEQLAVIRRGAVDLLPEAELVEKYILRLPTPANFTQ